MTNNLPPNTKHSLQDWFMFILKLLVSCLVIYKLAISNLYFDFSKLDFNSLLALILSIFAIALSILFYFKATETSNLFYDNTYKFTKDISEILGRIEAGFGERLRHLDEGYNGLIGKFDNGSYEQNIKETKEEIEKEKEKLKEEIEERNKIVESLIEKSQLEQGEKEKIRVQLKNKEMEIAKQNKEIAFLKEKLAPEIQYEFENELDDILIHKFPRQVVMPLYSYFKNKKNTKNILSLPNSIIIQKFKLDLNLLSQNEIISLQNYQVIDDKGDFTIHGVNVSKKIIHNYIEKHGNIF